MQTATAITLDPQTKSAASMPYRQKEETMNNEKSNILYERLSHEDGRENVSLSIENQQAYLEEYAIKGGFTNFIHYTDDGWSGTQEIQAAKFVPSLERGQHRKSTLQEHCPMAIYMISKTATTAQVSHADEGENEGNTQGNGWSCAEKVNLTAKLYNSDTS